jgi:hypothetical protein
MSAYVKKSAVPETTTGEVGTAKRNILRRSAPGKSRKEGLPGSNVDDGSNHIDNCALDEDDPNYDSEDDKGVPIPRYSSLHRDDVTRSAISLPSYKKRSEVIIAEYFVSGDIDDTAHYIMVRQPPLAFHSCPSP